MNLSSRAIRAHAFVVRVELRAAGLPMPPREEAMAKRKKTTVRKKKTARKKTIILAGLRRAIEGRDGRALTDFYAENAVIRIIDRDNPPSRPREISGRAAIGAFHDDVCGRAMTHKIESGVAEGSKLAFVELCTYPDGIKVYCSAMLELSGGKIARQTVVQAWDA